MEQMTSLEAAENAEKNAETLRQSVLQFLRDRGIRGATDDEIQVALDLHVSTQVPRRRELVLSGKVMESGFVRKTRKGCNALVWVASDVGAGMEKGTHKSLKLQLKEARDEIAALRAEVQRLHINTIIKVSAGMYRCRDCNSNWQDWGLVYGSGGNALCPRCRSPYVFPETPTD